MWLLLPIDLDHSGNVLEGRLLSWKYDCCSIVLAGTIGGVTIFDIDDPHSDTLGDWGDWWPTLLFILPAIITMCSIQLLRLIDTDTGMPWRKKAGIVEQNFIDRPVLFIVVDDCVADYSSGRPYNIHSHSIVVVLIPSIPWALMTVGGKIDHSRYRYRYRPVRWLTGHYRPHSGRWWWYIYWLRLFGEYLKRICRDYDVLEGPVTIVNIVLTNVVDTYCCSWRYLVLLLKYWREVGRRYCWWLRGVRYIIVLTIRYSMRTDWRGDIYGGSGVFPVFMMCVLKGMQFYHSSVRRRGLDHSHSIWWPTFYSASLVIQLLTWLWCQRGNGWPVDAEETIYWLFRKPFGIRQWWRPWRRWPEEGNDWPGVLVVMIDIVSNRPFWHSNYSLYLIIQ